MSGRRILISCYFPRSVELEGVGSLVRGFAQEFVRAGWAVTLLLPRGEYRIPGVSVATYESGLLGLSRYRRAVRKHSASADVTLLVENNPALGASADCTVDAARTRVLFYSPLQSFSLVREMGWSKQALVHAVGKHWFWARRVDWRDKRCVVGSEFQAGQLRSLGCGQVDVLPASGVSREATVLSRPAARRSLGWDDQPVVGYLGHYSRAKGVDVLLKAFDTYTSLSAGAGVLALAYSGKGALVSAGRSALERLRSRGRVRELGVCDPLDFLAACDVVALPYITSSIFHQPQVMLESLAASTSVITTSLGGFAELPSQGPCGLVIPARDADALTTAVAQSLADLPALHAMGQRGRAVFEASCPCERVVEYMSDVARVSRP